MKTKKQNTPVQNSEISQIQQLQERLAQEKILRDNRADLTRARSITVGTAFGGTSEITMRMDDGTSVWCVMQPVEIIELIHQLAANVGCNVGLQPRKDFASWREWRISQAEKQHLNGHPPFVNDMAVHQQLGASNYDQGFADMINKINLEQEEYEYVDGAAQKKLGKKKSSEKKIES